jgi:anti-anti-sigma regulatory factor
MKLTYRPLSNEEILRVVCEGQISTRGKPPSSEPLLELLGPHCYRQKVILNLERTDGTDTSGLMWLVRLATKFTQHGGRLIVYGFGPSFRNMLDVLGMIGTVSLVTSEQIAIETASKPGDSTAEGNGTPRPVARAYPAQHSDAV